MIKFNLINNFNNKIKIYKINYKQTKENQMIKYN